jgi:hypothetical protein
VDLPAGSTPDQGEVTTCTLETLRQDPGAVVAEVNGTGRPALVTDGGRFVAMISPLLGVAVESILLQGLGDAAALSEVASTAGDELRRRP